MFPRRREEDEQIGPDNEPLLTAVAVQSSYIPWKGFFDLMHRADFFVLYDDVQYTRRDWRNRNRIKTAGGLQWLSIPVNNKGHRDQLIMETTVTDGAWRKKHWRAIEQNYRSTPFFDQYANDIASLYLENDERRLSWINRGFIEFIAEALGIDTQIMFSMELEPRGDRVERLIDICRKVGAERYLSGPSARGYLEPRLDEFTAEGIAVDFMSYDDYPEYPQRYPPFEHGVSALDLLFNVGPRAPEFLLHAKK